jgi:hypothetical protein
MDGGLFQISGDVKVQLGKKGYDPVQWPTFTSAVNEMETVGCFKVDMEVHNAKSLRLVSDMIETIIWGKFSRRHLLKKKTSGIEVQVVLILYEAVEE